MTIYTPRLEAAAKRVVTLHNSDPNAAQISLLNLLFRSISGSIETTLDSNCNLKEMDNEEGDTLEGEHNHVATVQNYSIGEQDQIEITSDIEMEGDVEDISCGEEGI